MKFIEKIKKVKIDLITYYKEDVGIAFESNGNLYYAKTMESEYWICIASKPTIAGFCGIDGNTIYFCTFPDGYRGKVINNFFDIEKKEVNLLHIEFPINGQIRSLGLLKRNLFEIRTELEHKEYRSVLFNNLTNKWKLLEADDRTGLSFIHDMNLFFPLGGKQCTLIAYNLNTFEPLWKTSLEPYSRYKENLNDTVYNPGRLADFIGLFGNELILLVTNQILLAVDITTGVVTWSSEPMLNYDPESKFTFNPINQQYTWKEEHLAKINIQAIKESGVLHHGPLMFSSSFGADTERGFIYFISKYHLIEINIVTKATVVTNLAVMLPFPQVYGFNKMYFSKGLLYIALSLDAIMPSVLTVYNPVTKSFQFIHQFKITITDVLFFGDKFYIKSWKDDLYEFER